MVNHNYCKSIFEGLPFSFTDVHNCLSHESLTYRKAACMNILKTTSDDRIFDLRVFVCNATVHLLSNSFMFTVWRLKNYMKLSALIYFVLLSGSNLANVCSTRFTSVTYSQKYARFFRHLANEGKYYEGTTLKQFFSRLFVLFHCSFMRSRIRYL